jgi:hypothetical protein
MKPNNVNKKFLEEQVRLMLNEVGPQDVGAGSFDPEGVDDLSKTMKSAVKMAKKIGPVIQAMLVGSSDPEIEALGEELASIYTFGSGPETVYKEAEHFLNIVEKHKLLRLSTRIVTTGLGRKGQNDLPPVTKALSSAEVYKPGEGIEPNREFFKKIHGFLERRMREFGIIYDAQEGKVIGFDRDKFPANKEELSKVRREMVEATKLLLTDYLPLKSFYSSRRAKIDNSFWDHNKLLQKGFDFIVSQLQMYVLQCIPELYKITNKEEKYPWTGPTAAGKDAIPVYMDLEYKLRGGFDSEDNNIIDFEDLLYRSIQRIKKIKIRNRTAVNVTVEALKNIVQFKYGGDLLAKPGIETLIKRFPAMQRMPKILTGIMEFAGTVAIDEVTDLIIDYKITPLVKSYYGNYITFSGAVERLIELSAEFFELQKGGTSKEELSSLLSDIDDQITKIKDLSFQVNQAIENEFFETLELDLREKSKNFTGSEAQKYTDAIEDLKFINKQASEYTANISPKSLFPRLQPVFDQDKDAPKVGISYDLDCDARPCINHNETQHYVERKEDEIFTFLGDLIDAADLVKKDFEKMTRLIPVVAENIKMQKKELQQFVEELNKERKADEIKAGSASDNEAKVKPDGEWTGGYDPAGESYKENNEIQVNKNTYLIENPDQGGDSKIMKTIKGAATVAVSLAAFWALEKLKKGLAPEKIENSQTVHDVRSYLIAHFNLTRSKLSMLSDIEKTFGQNPSSGYIKSKQEYLTKNIFNVYYSKWKGLFGSGKNPAAAAWIHRPMYIVDISTKYLKNYDSHRISMAFDVIGHPIAVRNKKVAIRKDRTELFYKRSYNNAEYTNLLEAMESTAKIIKAADDKLGTFISSGPTDGDIDGVARDVVEQFQSFVKIFSQYFEAAVDAMENENMDPAKRAFHMDKLGKVMEILRS